MKKQRKENQLEDQEGGREITTNLTLTLTLTLNLSLSLCAQSVVCNESSKLAASVV